MYIKFWFLINTIIADNTNLEFRKLRRKCDKRIILKKANTYYIITSGFPRISAVTFSKY